MAWVAVDGMGIEWIYASKPYRNNGLQNWEPLYKDDYVLIDMIELPKGTIEKIIGRELTWGDEPVELEEE